MLDALATPQPVRRADYRPPDWQVRAVTLDFDLDAKATRVRARLSVERSGDHARPLVLDGEGLKLLAVQVDGRALDAGDYGLTDAALSIPLAADRAEIATEVEIVPAANTRLMGLYASGGKLCTQCEAEGFRRITYFPDRPDVLSRFTVTLNADRDRYPVLLANGNRVAAGELGDGRHWARWDDPYPKPCYLFALVAGDLQARTDRFVTASGRTVDLAIWVDAADVPRTAHAMAALKSAMAWDERVYGREYDLDCFNIVAVNDFNFGAMENKGLNIFNSKYILADAQTATDADYDAIAAVVAHEYFHNWTGNRITCRDWFQLSLKEGLTVFRDQQFSGDHGSPVVKRIEDVRTLRAIQFPEDAGPLAHPVRPESYIEISNFYTATVYNKGAEVIRMAAALLGPERFRRGTDLYFARHDGEAVTIEDWVRALEDGGGIDLQQFRGWYAQAGTPHVAARWWQDLGEGSVTLELSQAHAGAVAAPLHIPIKVALIGAQSGRQIGEEQLIELRQPQQTFRFDNVREPVTPSLNRGFTAPIVLEAAYDRASLAHLSRADTDGFARYEAMQRLALLTINQRLDGGAHPGDAEQLIAAFAATLERAAEDAAFVAEALLLPSEALIGDQRAWVDVEAIHDTREALRRELLGALGDRLWHWYAEAADAGYAQDARAKGRRRLRSVLLGLLMAEDGDRAVAVAEAQYADATNMTDRLGALALLASSHAPARERCLADFHTSFRADPLVIDKWFSIQAMAHRADTLETVAALCHHPDFSLANPNRARALLGAFGANQHRFHAADGAGYALIADMVLALDKLNPQTAARIVQPLARWRRFDPHRAGLMRATLERVRDHPGLSKDVFEMVTRSLDQPAVTAPA